MAGPAPLLPPPELEQCTLHDGPTLQIGYIVVRPAHSRPGALESATRHVLALPVAGVFAKHDGPQRSVLATPGHGLLITAGQPYRLSFPGGVGDRCLALRLSSEGLARALPEAQGREGFNTEAFAAHVPLPAAVLLARSVLLARLRQGDMEPLEAEEQGLAVLVATLAAARRQPRSAPPSRVGRLRAVLRTQEALWSQPTHPWSLADLASRACVSASHLAHAFRAETGSTVHGYVLRSRLALALDAVLDSQTAFTTIALDTGFASHSHFTARFRGFFGHTPQALRHGAGAGQARQLRKIVTARPASAI